jgi:hypothetical protein
MICLSGGIVKSTKGSIDVAASHEIVLRVASDPALLAEWNNEYIGCGAAKPQEDGVIFRCKTHCGDKAMWRLKVSKRFHGSITHVDATIEEHTGVRHPLRWLRTKRLRRKMLALSLALRTKRLRRKMLALSLARLKGFMEGGPRTKRQRRKVLALSLARLKGFMEGGPRNDRQREKVLALSLARLKGFAEADARDHVAARDHAAARPGGDGLKPGDLQPGDKVALLNVYTSQFASYTTLLWQVPALGLTAQPRGAVHRVGPLHIPRPRVQIANA